MLVMAKLDTTYFSNDDTSPKSVATDSGPKSISWTAPDASKRTYTKAWYLKIGLFFILITAGAYFWLDSIITAVLFIVVYIALIIYTKKSPQTINYQLSHEGIVINDQLYKLEDFSSFGVLADRNSFLVVLLPTKRIATSLNLTCDEKDGERIVDFLGSILPMRDIHENFVDKLIRQIGL